jgi:hypothetical protein
MPHSTQAHTIDTTKKHGDWRDDLFRDGYAVVKGVISPEKSQEYIEDMFAWLEKFPFGFDRNNPQTWSPEHLPTHMKLFPLLCLTLARYLLTIFRGGMYHGYAVQHERFMWEARQ